MTNIYLPEEGWKGAIYFSLTRTFYQALTVCVTDKE
jgi:hypothetical protein